MLKYIYIYTYLCTISQLVVYIKHTVCYTYICTYSMTTVNMATREGRTKLKETGKAKGSENTRQHRWPHLNCNFKIRVGYWSPTLP